MLRKVEDINQWLLNKFRKTGYETLVDWIANSNLKVSHETASSVLYRGRKVGLKSALELAIALGCDKSELVTMLKLYGDDLIWRVIDDKQYSPEDKAWLERIYSCTAEQRKVILDMIKVFTGEHK